MYAFLRTDLQMTAGKAASQASHAFLDSFLTAPQDIARSYLADGGTKIVLAVPGERELCDLLHKAKTQKLPCAMVVEQDHVMPPHFDGSPIPTAVGIGPLLRSEAKRLAKGWPLLKRKTRSPIAQRLERLPLKQCVAGSNPAGRARLP